MKNYVSILMLLICAGTTFPPHHGKSAIASGNLFPVIASNLKDGDLVLREGKGLVSEMFSKFSIHDPHYSHAGVLLFENEKPYVYHVIGSSDGGKGGLKKESLADFCASTTNYSFAVYRTALLNDKANVLKHFFNLLGSNHITFDEHFDLRTDNELYCSEMIYKMVLEISGNSLPKTKFKNGEYIAIDNLYLNQWFTKITEYKYPKSL